MAVFGNAAGDDRGGQLQLSSSGARIGQHGFRAAAVKGEDVIVAGLHHGGGIAERLPQRYQAAGLGKEQGIAVRIGQAGFKQRRIGKRAVFIGDCVLHRVCRAEFP